MPPAPCLRPYIDRVLVDIQVVPRASRTRLAGLHGERLKIQIAAPPVDGAANRELQRFLAKHLGIAARDVEVVSGAGGRRKTVAVTGIAVEDIAARLEIR